MRNTYFASLLNLKLSLSCAGPYPQLTQHVFTHIRPTLPTLTVNPTALQAPRKVSGLFFQLDNSLPSPIPLLIHTREYRPVVDGIFIFSLSPSRRVFSVQPTAPVFNPSTLLPSLRFEHVNDSIYVQIPQVPPFILCFAHEPGIITHVCWASSTSDVAYATHTQYIEL